MKTKALTLLALMTIAAGLTVATAPIASAASVTPECSTGALAMTIGPANGTAGTIYYPLVFTNTTKKTCAVDGVPAVRASMGVNSMGGILVGHPARKVDRGVAGYGAAVTIKPGGRASALYGVVESGNFSRSACAPVNARSISVSFMGRPYWASLRFSLCTKISSTTISGVVAGSSGIAR